MELTALQHALQRTLPDARIDIAQLPGLPLMRLGLINADFSTDALPQEVMQAVIHEPAYWAFCWGSGLALAQFLTRNPFWVSDKIVVDLGSGSGVVAIAAVLAGAKRVIACDTDPDARAAAAVNAALNQVDLEIIDNLEALPPQCDLLVMADVLYDKQNLPLLSAGQARAREVLVADSRVTELPVAGYRKIIDLDAATYPNLGEFDEFGTTHIYHWNGDSHRNGDSH